MDDVEDYNDVYDELQEGEGEGLPPEPELDEASADFVASLVDKIVEFMDVLVGHQLRPYQLPFAKRIIESIIIEDAEEITALFARQSGKALALDTRVPTPNGWSSQGRLAAGDEVFGPDGKPIKVLSVFPIEVDRPCARVTFRDGQEVIADLRHEWVTADDDLVETGDLAAGAAIAVAGPLHCPDVRLSVDPYMLGVWLGDGTCRQSDITCADPEIVDELRRRGYAPIARPERYAPYGWAIPKLRQELIYLDLINNSDRELHGRKHIPLRYKRASESQRMDLLRGLMDSDGYVSKKGSIEFTTTDPTLAADVLELVRGLGLRASRGEDRARLNGVDCGPRWRIRFQAYASDGICILPRKLARLKQRPLRTRTDRHWVRSVQTVPSEPVRCIEVEGGVYLVGNSLIPTHNSETVCNVVATLMVLLPRLARLFPDVLGKFKDGLWVGIFAPVEGQAETLFGRIVTRLTSEHALLLLQDPEIDDRPIGSTRAIRLKKSGSMCLMMTANPRAKIESKTFHLAVIDEAQDCDDYVVRKSIHPMLASTAGTIVKTGTPTTRKGDFYKAIQLNKRRQTGRSKRQNHFEADWKVVAKYSPVYGKAVRRDMVRMGEDSDEFMMSYNLKWLLERGMFTTSAMMEQLGDLSQEVVRQWHRTPVVVGIDPARKLDSTVVTVVWVDWDRPDEFGFYDHRVLNWLEIRGDDWEEQYFQISNFLASYDVLAIGVDAGGVGDAVAQRLQLLMPRASVFPVSSSPTEQSKRWKHLMALMQRGLVGWPAHAKTRRLRTWRRFTQQMLDAEKIFQGPNIMVKAPDEAEAHDDFVDSISIACSMTLDLTLPEVQVTSSPFFGRSR